MGIPGRRSLGVVETLPYTAQQVINPGMIALWMREGDCSVRKKGVLIERGIEN
jgi:hypothetical protein